MINTERSGLDFEAMLNNLLQRLFPAWYASHAVKEMALTPIGTLNPNSYLSHRWLSLHSVIKSVQTSLASGGEQWQALNQLLEKLIVENQYPRPLSISAIVGVELSEADEDWPALLYYAEQYCDDVPWQSAVEFDHNLSQSFPDDDKPFNVVYREWDGRYYWQNKEEPRHFAAALRYVHHTGRDASISALINVESLHQATFDRIRHDYWLLVMNRDNGYQLADLLSRANLDNLLCEFEWRRSDLILLVAPKNNKAINQILLNLQNNRSTQQITDFGRFLSRYHRPFRNQ